MWGKEESEQDYLICSALVSPTSSPPLAHVPVQVTMWHLYMRQNINTRSAVFWGGFTWKYKKDLGIHDQMGNSWDSRAG